MNIFQLWHNTLHQSGSASEKDTHPLCPASSRDEDRAILIALKTRGASRDTFSVLSEKLNKPSAQVSSSVVVCHVTRLQEVMIEQTITVFLLSDCQQI